MNEKAEPDARANATACHDPCLRTARAKRRRGSSVTLGKMKKLVLVASVAVLAAVGALVFRAKKEPPSIPSYHEGVIFALEQMRHVRMPDGTACIGSSARPLGRPPHPFFLLTRYLSAAASPPDLELMLKDASPAVRIAAADIILWENRWGIPKRSVEVLLNDQEAVTVLDDCIPARTTVGKLVAELRTNPQLFDRDRKTPNQPPEPTR